MQSADAVVIGAGIQGLAIAHELASRDPSASVVVVDAGLVGAGTSLLGGVGVRTQFAHATNVALSLRAIEMMATWRERFGVDPDFTPSGYLYLASTPGHVAVRESVADTARTAGARIDRLGPDEIAELLPGLDVSGVLGGWHSPSDGMLWADLVVGSLRDACARLGVRIVEGSPARLRAVGGRIESVETADGGWATRTAIVAAGLASRALLNPFGVEVPVRSQRGQIFLSRRPASLPPRTPLVLDMSTRAYFAGTRKGLVLGGDDREDGDDFDGADAARIVALVRRRVRDLHPGLVFGGQAGTRATSPDDLGILGEVPGLEGAVLATGFGHHGFMHAVPAAEILVDLLEGRTPAIDPSPMDPGRFGEGIIADSATPLPGH
ncbi:MAG: FAD-binding oxidoreductase [Protaetiibacter sp.]